MTAPVFQSGGCCDGSAPMCYPDGDFKLGQSDVHLGDLKVEGLERPIGFYMSESQFEYWKHTHLTVDVVKGRGSGFSVEAPEGVRFLIRSRLLSDDEWEVLDRAWLIRPRAVTDRAGSGRSETDDPARCDRTKGTTDSRTAHLVDVLDVAGLRAPATLL